MKKAFWAGLIIVLAGGAVITATAIDKIKDEPAAGTQTEATQSVPAPEEKAEESKQSSESAPSSSSSSGGVIGAPTVEPVLYGSPDAPVIIEEFASFTCPHCAHFHKDILPELSKEILEKGGAQLQMYSYVRNEQDLRATQLVYCVKGNDGRQRFTKAILQAQEQWAHSTDFVGNLRVMAQVGGISNERFDECMADKDLEDKIIRNREYASGLGISSTPYFVIGKEEIKGARDFETFKAAIEAAQANQENSTGK